MRVIYMYHQEDPLHGSIVPGSLPNAQQAFKGYKPLSITQRQQQDDTLYVSSLSSSSSTTLTSSSPSSTSTVSLSAASSASRNAKDAQLPISNNKLHIFELLNEDVKLPTMDTMYWCKVFEFQEFSQKQHLVKVSYVIRKSFFFFFFYISSLYFY